MTRGLTRGEAVSSALAAALAVATAAAAVGGAPNTLQFVLGALALLVLAWVVGVGTEQLGESAGPRVGGVLNATFGNAAELIITIFAIRAGEIDVARASITGFDPRKHAAGAGRSRCCSAGSRTGCRRSIARSRA